MIGPNKQGQVMGMPIEHDGLWPEMLCRLYSLLSVRCAVDGVAHYCERLLQAFGRLLVFVIDQDVEPLR